MRNDLSCPYCHQGQEVCHDDGAGYSEDVRHEMECSACGKSFVFTTSISFHYTPSKADCLNSLPHKLKETFTVPRRYTRLACEYCDHQEGLPEGHPYLKGEQQ